MKARKGAVVTKVDLEKAYNHLEWSFIAHTLEDSGMPGKICDVIMQLILKGSCCLLWNGDATNIIKPRRGLRHRDPLSPYLFVLCMETLGHWTLKRVKEGS